MSNIQKLSKRRGVVKTQITRMENVTQDGSGMSPSEAQVRLQKLNDWFEEFGSIQQLIEDETEGIDDQRSKECHETERQQFEDKFYALASILQRVIDRDKEQREERRVMASRGVQNEEQYNQNQGNEFGRVDIRRSKAKLPEIKLPEFDGDYSKWVLFKTSFETVIHNDGDLAPAQKHQYLLGVLKGEALKVVRGFSVNEENYEQVWKLLKETYDNEIMILETHLEELVNFPSVEKDNKAEGLKNLVWHIQTHLQSLKALAQPVDTWDTLIIHLARRNLDYMEQKEWQDRVKGKTPQDMPKLKDFITFLTERSHTLRMLNQKSMKSNTVNSSKHSGHKEKKIGKVVAAVTSDSCKYCNKDHGIFRCEEFLKLSVKERKQKTLEKRLCMNCFKKGHIARDCTSSKCRTCGSKHNTLLHEDEKRNDQNQSQQETAVSMYCIKKPMSQVILSTAKVFIQGNKKKKVYCRALLDPGSQINIISQKLCKKLSLQYSKLHKTISGINQAQVNASKTITTILESIHGNFKTEISCLVLPSITEKIPQIKWDVNKFNQPKDVKLADPEYNEPGEVELLIGAGLYWKLVVGAPENNANGQPAWQNTRLGWICGGEITSQETNTEATCLKVTNLQLQQQVEKFWIQESLPEIKSYSKEERQCDNFFEETTTRSTTGRFIVKLPMKSAVKLGESKNNAMKRLYSIEKRFRHDQQLKKAYVEFMQDYLNQNHMSPVNDLTQLEYEEHYFIPHQPVIRPESISTKLRVVFDASAKSSSGATLNDKLMPGPNLQGNLFEIIIRFRTHQVVLTGDVAQMYRQILVHPDDRKYQLILWRKDESDDPQVYQLNTVTYGTACAPYHALKCIKQLASIYKDEYKVAAKAIENDLYMDDCLSGGNTVEDVKKLQSQLSEVLLKAQFVMRKWCSNNSKVLQFVKQQHSKQELLILDKDEAIKTLGLLWNAKEDMLQYQTSSMENSVDTKRSILSKVSQIFDPLGLISPVLIIGKILLQELWVKKVEWDEVLDEESISCWNQYYQSLKDVNKLIIPRNVNPGNFTIKFDLVGFADASEKAYGACFYVVSQTKEGVYTSQLLCAKSRVAPVKTISLPRLELEAALILSELYKTIKSSMQNKINKTKLWSDSTIVLGWIKTEPRLLKTYVANRVSKIQSISDEVKWQHVPTTNNSADIISRGMNIGELQDKELWWYGPSWLRTVHGCPEVIEEPETQLPELKAIHVIVTEMTLLKMVKKFSSLEKICRIIAYCYRFGKNCRKLNTGNKLSVKELQQAETAMLRLVQRECFQKEIVCLKRNQELPKKSPLKSLKVFLDNNSLVRVGGRLSNSSLSESQKHPIVLPAKHHITSLIFRQEHENAMHCPPEQLLHSIRGKFWPISGRREAQKTVKRCIRCFRFKPTITDTLMGDLPRVRVTAYQRPFTNTGLDYAGPIQIRESRRRGRMHVSKGYIAVFTCMSTKAIHLELVSDMTTDAFMAAMRRFMSRRGICARIYSDNGTNFVGASRELKAVYEWLEANQSELNNQLLSHKIEWHFIPPRAPHFGGLWEAVVKVTKRHLYTITQGKVYTFEEYGTLLCQIEGVLNSRPLTPLTNDPNDLKVLTPAHFLIGESLSQPAEHSYLDTADNRLSRWQQFQKLQQLFWKRWKCEYLQELQKRNKWLNPGKPIELVILVLIVEDNVSPLQWPLGRVVEIHPGKDGITRVVTIKTANGTYKRSVNRLCPLPLVNEEEEE